MNTPNKNTKKIHCKRKAKLPFSKKYQNVPSKHAVKPKKKYKLLLAG